MADRVINEIVGSAYKSNKKNFTRNNTEQSANSMPD